jgi:hypothetical protein
MIEPLRNDEEWDEETIQLADEYDQADARKRAEEPDYRDDDEFDSLQD